MYTKNWGFGEAMGNEPAASAANIKERGGLC